MSPKSSPDSPRKPQLDLESIDTHTHSVQFYSDDAFLMASLSRFMGSAVGAGDAVIVIATPAHREELAKRLSARGLDLRLAVEQGRYVALDAAETLKRFMVNGWPDEERFVATVGGVITRAKEAAHSEHGRAALFGEMVAVLWEQGKTEAALRLEQLWNQIAHSHSFSLVCAYPLKIFYHSDGSDAFMKICAVHSAVLPSESYALASEDERMRLVAQWQQKALTLEHLVAEREREHEAAMKLAAIVESSEDAIISKDLNGIVTSWNPGAERMFEYKAEEIIGRSITLIIPPELHTDEEMILGKIRRGERLQHFETVRLTKGGERVDVSLSVSPIMNERGRIIGAAKIARDVTRAKQTEAALRQAEKLAASGQLAASIAHEINNPMQSLTNLLALIANGNSLDEETRELLGMADGELRRMSHIARQMLSFHRESSAPVPLKITEVIEDVLEVLAASLRARHVVVERRYQSHEPVRAFPVEMRQLLANLLTNAAEAIGYRGRILIHVAASQDWKNPEREGVRIVVADNGSGIEAQVRSRIFEPFFTTKRQKGTGLGLWVAKGIVAKHGGSLRLRSSTRRGRSGTLFSIFLPAETGNVLVRAPTIKRTEAA